LENYIAFFQVKKYLPSSTPIYVIINNTQKSKALAYAQGAIDYLSYPIIFDELSIRIKSSFLLLSAAEKIKKLDDIQPKATTELLFEKACHYLMTSLNQPHSLNKLASILGTNRNVLTQVFTEHTGLGAMSWLRVQRMAKAKNLLCDSCLTIQQICYAVGYEDPANFATAFNHLNHLSPTHFRKMIIAQQTR